MESSCLASDTQVLKGNISESILTSEQTQTVSLIIDTFCNAFAVPVNTTALCPQRTGQSKFLNDKSVLIHFFCITRTDSCIESWISLLETFPSELSFGVPEVRQFGDRMKIFFVKRCRQDFEVSGKFQVIVWTPYISLHQCLCPPHSTDFHCS